MRINYVRFSLHCATTARIKRLGKRIMKGKRVSPLRRAMNTRASRSPGNFAREFGIWSRSLAREASHSTPQTVITRARRREVTCFLQRILIRNAELGLLNLPASLYQMLRRLRRKATVARPRETETFAATQIRLLAGTMEFASLANFLIIPFSIVTVLFQRNEPECVRE